MKKFEFPLDTVLVYKRQALDVLQGEHAAILAKVNEQSAVLESISARYYACSDEFNEKQRKGLQIAEALIYQSGLRTLETQIARESERLKTLQNQEEKKRDKVVEAKKEISSIEKIREKKLELYQKSLQKEEENKIEEFVSVARTRESGQKESDPMNRDAS